MDRVSKERRSKIMSKIRSKDTKPEVMFRKMLWGLGIRGYRKHYGRHKIDVAFPKRKVAIFIDGCFWHGCPRHFRLPATNAGFWKDKIERNRARDDRVTKELKKEGWWVIRIWECDLNR